MDTLSTLTSVWFPEPARLSLFLEEFVHLPFCRKWSLRGYLLLISVTQVQQPRFTYQREHGFTLFPARAVTKTQGSEVTCSRSLVTGRNGLEFRSSAPSSIFPLYLLYLEWFCYNPAQSIELSSAEQLWRPLATIFSVFRDERKVLFSLI